MKLTKKNKIMIGAVSGVLTIAVIVTAVLLTGGNTHPVLTPDSEPESSPSEVVVNLPTDTKQEAQTSEPESTEKKDTLVVDVSGNPESPTDTDGNKNNDTAKSPEQPIETKKPEQPANDGDSGIIIGGGDTPIDQYSCGSPSHHCKNAEAHAYIQNLELEGCPFCESHSCPSFYDVNEWGFTRYNQVLCPKYNEKNDSAKYCQDCGRTLWSQSNPTGCFRYLQDTDCECGELVKGNTCHHH